MRKILALIVGLFAALFGVRALRATPPTTGAPISSIDAQVRSFAPTAMVRAAASAGAVQVQYFDADLGNTGKYDYVVAEYQAPAYGAKVVVLRNINGRLQLAGTMSIGDGRDYSDGTLIEPVYVDNSGVPAIEVQSVGVNGQHYGFDLLRWTGTSLVPMFPHSATMEDSYLADPKGTGVPEVVNPPYCDQDGCTGNFAIYQLKNTGLYALTATSTSDPTGLTPPPGSNLPLPGLVTVRPSQFSAEEILANATGSRSGDDVVLRFGNLAPIDPDASGTDVSEIDFGSVYVGRNLKPLSIQVIGASKGKALGFDGSFIEVTLPRRGVLRYLAKAQPSKPPTPGDVVALPLEARLKNGLTLFGAVSVKIVSLAGQ
jgi:hypothetical protein